MDTEVFSDDIDFDDDLEDLDPEALDDGPLVDDAPDDASDDSSEELVTYRLDTPSLDDIEASDDVQHSEIYVVTVHTSYYDDNVWHESDSQIDSVWDDYDLACERAEALPNAEDAPTYIELSTDVETLSGGVYEHNATWNVYRLEEKTGDDYILPSVKVVLDSVHLTRESAETRVEDLGSFAVSSEFRSEVRDALYDVGPFPGPERSEFDWNSDGISVDGNAVLAGKTSVDDWSEIYVDQRLPVTNMTYVGDVPEWQATVEGMDQDVYALRNVKLSEIEDLQHAAITVEPVRSSRT